ncbi:MAG TPA: penicillin-binding protein 2 [Alphaproteobacteria bacterium]|nr:penicillin-binding protein 2 [Alphaproteobacteria bacterium]
MKDLQDVNFKRRSVMLSMFQAGLACTLVSRLYYLQILSTDKYTKLAEKNRLFNRVIIPHRGHILDRQGQILATFDNLYRAVAYKDQIENWIFLKEKLKEILALDEEDLARLDKEYKKNSKLAPIKIKDKLTWQEVSVLEYQASELPGVMIEPGFVRLYPFHELTCHTVGYVGAPLEKDQAIDPILAQPGARVGKTGLERYYEERLKGKPGVQQLEVNALREVIRPLERVPEEPGEDLRLSLDLEVQKLAGDLLAPHQSGSAVVLDCKTGGVIALCSYPTFDTNLFSKGIPSKNWQELLNDPLKPLTNKAIAGVYPPGSTLKMVIALAALEAGVIDEHTSFFCPGHMMVGDHKFHCWKKCGHGTVRLYEALSRSCDVYFYQLAHKLSIDKMSAMMQRFGLGSLTGIDLLEEKAGLVPTRSWKERLFKRGWTLGESVNTSIGQGYMLTTPLQLAKMTAMIATGGKLITPRLFEKLSDQGGVDVNPKHLSLIQKGMWGVVNDPFGSAAACFHPSIAIAGKTGTAQVKRISQKDRQLNTINKSTWHLKDHALFVGYAPFENPKVACCVVVEHGGGGSRIAAPIGKELLASSLKNCF